MVHSEFKTQIDRYRHRETFANATAIMPSICFLTKSVIKVITYEEQKSRRNRTISYRPHTYGEPPLIDLNTNVEVTEGIPLPRSKYKDDDSFKSSRSTMTYYILYNQDGLHFEPIVYNTSEMPNDTYIDELAKKKK